MNSIMSFRNLLSVLEKDASRYSRLDSPPSLLRVWVLYPGFRFTIIFRIREEFSNSWLRLFRGFMTFLVLRAQRKSGIQINPGCEIGPGLYLPHYGGIVVNQGAKIGANALIAHNVTIGKIHSGKRKGVPTIGDDVFLAAGAVVLGGITIGNNVVVGPNSVVIDDVPDNAVVAGNPAKIISMKGSRAVLGRDSILETVETKTSDTKPDYEL